MKNGGIHRLPAVPATAAIFARKRFPQAMRGALFLLIGATAAVVAVLTLNRLPFRRRGN